MKKTYCILLTVITVLLAGCQTTPEESVVIGKGDGQLEEKIVSETDAALPSDISGTRITETYRHDSLPITIEVDALVDTQDGKTMPAVKVMPYRFTQEEVDAVYDRFVGGAHFFRIPDGEDWDRFAEAAITDIEMQLSYARESGDYSEDYIERLESNLEEARRESLAAQPATAFPAAAHTLGGEGVFGYFERDGMAYRFNASTDESGMAADMCLQRCSPYDVDISWDDMYGVAADIVYTGEDENLRELPYDDALALAQDTVSAFGAQGMAVAFTEGKQYPESTLESYYTFIFTHEVNGVPCMYNATGIANDAGYSDVWDYERLIVSIDAHGVKSAHWIAPCDITQQLSESAPMISFAEVMDCFSKMVFIKNSYFEDQIDGTSIIGGTALDEDNPGVTGGQSFEIDSMVINIDRITLGLMRVQSGDEFLLIPVWDFYGTQQLLTADGEDILKLSWESSTPGEYRPQESGLLTINAIDGSVIDREMGY